MLRVCQSFEMIQVDAAVVPPVQGQPGPPATVRLGVQPGEPPASTGAAPTRADMDADDAAGEADQDRGQGRPPCQGRHVPAGGGGGCLGRCSRRSWGGSVACERRRASGDHSSGVDGSDVEPRRTGMVRREVRATGRGTSRSGPSGARTGIRLAGRPNLTAFPWTIACDRHPMRVQQKLARSQTTRSTLIWEIPVERSGPPVTDFRATRPAQRSRGPSSRPSHSWSTSDADDPLPRRRRP